MKRTGDTLRVLFLLAVVFGLAGVLTLAVHAQQPRPGTPPPPPPGVPTRPPNTTVPPNGPGGQPTGLPPTVSPFSSPTAPGMPGAEEEESNTTTIIIVVCVVLVLGGIVVAVVVSQNKKPKKEEGSSQEGIIGGYRLLNHLMTGQASMVYEVVEVSSGRHFAMKMLLPEKVTDEDHRKLLFHEAEVGQKLAHPNIIRIVKVMKSAKTPNFVMEFFPSGSLKLKIMHKEAEFLKEHTPSVLKQIATALAFMNAEGWVHRDVKPDNMLVNAAGDAKLIDFALAQRITKKGMGFGRKKKVQGTRSYMSPEQIRGEPLDGRADVYSFGASCYEIVTGRPPFRAASSQELLAKHITEKPVTPRQYNPDVTEEFADLVLRMLAKKREDRPKDFHEVLMKLRQIRVFKSQTAQPSVPY